MKKFLNLLFIATLATFTLVSCSKNDNAEVPDTIGHKVNFIVQGKISKPATKTYIEQSGDKYLAHWSDVSQEKIGIIIGDVVKDMTAHTFNASSINNDVATFSGSAELNSGTYYFHSFYPASAFNKTYDSGKIGLTLKNVQNPVNGSFDPAVDILLATDKEVTIDNNAENVLIDGLVFTRPMAVLRVNLKAKSSEAKAYNEKVQSVEMNVPGQNTNFALTGNFSFLPNDSNLEWTIKNTSVKAVFTDTDNIKIHTDTDNSVFFVVNPTTISSGTIEFKIETDVHNGINAITRTVNVPDGGMEFLAGKVNEINLTVRDKDVPTIVADTRILVEGFDNCTGATNDHYNNFTPEQTGVFGTGVTDNLSYAYSTTQMIRVNSNGKTSTDPFMWMTGSGASLTISNIAISNLNALNFSAYIKKAGTLNVQYKASSESEWISVGSLTGTTAGVESNFDFIVSNTITSIDLKLVAAAQIVVDDIVLSPGSTPEHNLAVDNTTITLGGTASSTATINITSNYSWTASISEGSGFSIDPTSGGPNGSIVVTATNNGSSSEASLGKVTISDGEESVEVNIQQQAYNSSSSNNFTRITSISELDLGDNSEYLLIYVPSSGTPLALNGSLTSLDQSDGLSITFDGEGDADYDTYKAYSISIYTGSTSGKYYIKTKSGKYIGRNANSNGLNVINNPTSDYNNGINFSSTGEVTITGNGGRALCYNTTNHNYRYYAPSNCNNMYLYKHTNTSTAPIINPSSTTINVVSSGNDEASITYTITNAVSGIALSASTEEDWINNIDCSVSGIVTFKVAANTGAARVGTITLSYTNAADVTISINQASGSSGGETVTVTKSINQIVSENNYQVSSGTNIGDIVTSFNLDGVITISTTGSPNCGTIWGTTTNDWRLYQSANGNIIISASSGHTISKLTITYERTNNGTLKKGGSSVSSGSEQTINASSIEYTVDSNTSGTTNAQVRVTQISVTYN